MRNDQVLLVKEAGALLVHDGDLFLDMARVVGMNLGAVAVFERSDDAAAVGVVLGVGGGHYVHVQGQADAVALDLDVALLHQVEEAHLDALGEVGQFIDGENTPVGAGHQAVMDGKFVGEMATLGDLDGVDLANEVGYRDVGSGQLLGVAVLAADPVNGGIIAGLGHLVAAGLANGVEWVVVNLAAGNLGDGLIQQVDEAADEAGLGLAALTEQDYILTGQKGVFKLGYDGVLEADDAGEDDLLGTHLGYQVVAHLLADGKHPIAAVAKITDGLGPVGAWLGSRGHRIPP